MQTCRTDATVIGAGLAGCEAAYRLLKSGFSVTLYEMKPKKKSPAHQLDSFCELVCSNSLRSERLENAVGLLKQELRLLGSLIMECADEVSVPAGGALAVDRAGFSELVTKRLLELPKLTVKSEEVTEFPTSDTVIATGPLTEGAFAEAIANRVGTPLHFYDAAAPIVSLDSLNMDKIYSASRYDKGGDDYLNCPMSFMEYAEFYQALITAQSAPLHTFETPRVFEGCMPVEIMAKRGDRTLVYGPMKPVGLEVGKWRPYAVVQLRRDNAEGTLYNMVGFQTNLKFDEQKRVFRMIPGLENAEFVRYGVMHRNTFLKSPGILDWDYMLKGSDRVYFAGQMTGVEGYVESAASGLVAGDSLARRLSGQRPRDFTRMTAIGALGHYVSEYNGGDFQPMNASFGLMDELPERLPSKKERSLALSKRALELVKTLI
ncbi:MAG TPA: methylenetetrahydrofolate--tRNA-(uracil(54)-C(5))-methyltransferase (FADH(2)-oxidizing) TrmFO [Clostridia bacterium]|nr:methylenetetrahydrofolate--tRNA-(uracil(54)-C(5))-methyltransferase (FADH(2)-oxidizing) TrmFO [Clostridia bacterium]